MASVPSSTRDIPHVTAVPRHIAIIMDGNGRWAKQRLMPRVGGHQRGVETVREMVKACSQLGVEYLTLFAFSSENWRRPAEEVSFLMQLFLKMLEREVGKLHREQHPPESHRRPQPFWQRRSPSCIERAEQAHREQYQADADHRRQLRRPLGHHAGDACAESESHPERAARSAKKSSHAIFPCTTRRSRICSSAPAANSASATSCCGNWPTPNCISPTRLWPAFDSRRAGCGHPVLSTARAPLRPHQRAA